MQEEDAGVEGESSDVGPQSLPSGWPGEVFLELHSGQEVGRQGRDGADHVCSSSKTLWCEHSEF